MGKRLNLPFDSELLDTISCNFDLRVPNKKALRQLVFILNGEYDPDTIQVLNLATGVGKTYLMAAFIEYLRHQGVKNVVIVTPGKVVQNKTVQNFTKGSPRYIEGSQFPPDVVTPQDYSNWVTYMNGDTGVFPGHMASMLVFIFNIQQLIAPKDRDGNTHGSSQDAERRKPRRFDENAGTLFEYLKGLDDLVVIADESHLYSSSAAAFNAALKELDPAATIGLTASVLPEDHVIFKYPLYEAIRDQYVKSPVLAFRKGGYGADRISEEKQLRDALQLREIKQAYYDAYTEQNSLPHLNAVVFVVCADVDHATQVAELLRSPEYLGRTLAVLQVDSKHEDDATQRLLENLDRPDSPVLAVVSVNKLKEGWDVKNITVVVTLRAMASEVLTQQTMGRGLRLPFGKYTKIRQIDQLDIIAHQSFQELLTAEDVLVQFGLEDAVSEADKKKVIEDIKKNAQRVKGERDDKENAAANRVFDSQPSLNSIKNPMAEEPIYGKDKNNADVDRDGGLENGLTNPTVSIRALDEDDGTEDDNHSQELQPLVISRNPDFTDVEYSFPVTVINMTQPLIDLSEISEKDIERAAKRVTSTGDILYRKEIVAVLGKKLKAVDTESADIESEHIDEETAKEALTQLVINMQLVPKTGGTIAYIEKYLIPKFMKEVSFEKWTVKSLGSARGQLNDLIKDYIVEVQRSVKELPCICPKKMNLDVRIYPIGTKIHEPIEDAKEFVRGRIYSGWFKSLYKEESFDSYSGEYKIASILNTSPHIIWWHRLHPDYGAFIYYTARDRYFPDFVALDDRGTYWIIEAKEKKGKGDEIVRKKRKAAESAVRKLAAEAAYAGQNWGYLIAFEDDIRKAESWEDIKTYAEPVTNEV